MTNKTKHMKRKRKKEKKKKRKKEKKKKRKKDMGCGFFTQRSKFFHTLYFQSKRSLSNYISTNQDPTVLYEPSDRSC